MPFEYDPGKSASNKLKHGLDFEEAQAIWGDENRLQIVAKARGEQRSAMIGRIGGRLWVAFFTLRDDNVRLISVRRARDGERVLYENDLDS
jgi:uncharacterized DUF497 family protein